jgi:Chemotaxis protein histidine kinase and related kinases
MRISLKNLLVLETGSDEGAIGEIFRSAHSLKGMSASMGFEGMEKLCHAMEDVFQEIRNESLDVGPGLVDDLLAVVDDIEAMLDDIEAGGRGIPPDIDDKVRMLKNWIPGGEEPSEAVMVPTAGPGPEGIPDEEAYGGWEVPRPIATVSKSGFQIPVITKISGE